MTCSTRSSRATSSRTWSRRSWCSADIPRTSSPTSSEWWIVPSTSAVRGRWASRSRRAPSAGTAACRSPRGMPSLRLVVPLAALVLAAAATAAAAAPSGKFPAAATAAAGAAQISETGDFARVAPGPRRLLVTFGDTPRRAEAERRLTGLGSVAPALPEAGIWTLTPSDPADRARARAAPAGRGGGASGRSPARPPSSRARAAGAAGPAAGVHGPPPHLHAPVEPHPGRLDLGLRPHRDRPPPAHRDPRHRRRRRPTRSGPARTRPLVAPRSTWRRDNDATDWGLTGHGTHVAGIAAAPANGVGVVGVAPSGGGRRPGHPGADRRPRGRAAATTP